jgi:hypothetical protein
MLALMQAGVATNRPHTAESRALSWLFYDSRQKKNRKIHGCMASCTHLERKIINLR